MSPPLDVAIAQIESHVAALGAALRQRDASALEVATQTLQRTLAASIQRFAGAARAAGGVPLPLRRRLAVAGAQIKAQREQLARASAALERAMSILMPAAQPAAAYGAHGRLDRALNGESITA